MHFFDNLRRRLRDDQSGFTMVELLVVTIIIGTLATLGYAALIDERGKASDATAKSHASGLASEVQGCFQDTDTIRDCDTPAELEEETGLPWTVPPAPGPGTDCDNPPAFEPPPGDVSVVASDVDCYVIKATSESDDGGLGQHIYIFEHQIGSDPERTCTPVNVGLCPPDGLW